MTTSATASAPASRSAAAADCAELPVVHVWSTSSTALPSIRCGARYRPASKRRSSAAESAGRNTRR
jgi:hypothetical protein